MAKSNSLPVDFKWRSLPSDAIVWTRWDDDQFIVYHRPSGITHFLNAASALLLRDLLVEPSDASYVARAFAPATSDAAWDEHLEEITDMLLHLERLGLILRT